MDTPVTLVGDILESFGPIPRIESTMPAAVLLAILLEAAPSTAGRATPRYAAPPLKVARELNREHRKSDWYIVTTDAGRLEVRVRKLDVVGLHGLKGRDAEAPPPRDIEWGRIARIDVVTSGKTLGSLVGAMGGILIAASTAGGGGTDGSAWVLAPLMGNVIGGYVGSRHTGTSEFYVATLLPGSAPVPPVSLAPALAASGTADTSAGAETVKPFVPSPSTSAEPASADTQTAPQGTPVLGPVHTEFSAGVSGLAALGGFAKVSRPCMGADAAVLVIHRASHFGVRAAGGIHLLRGYTIPTGEPIFTATGTQDGRFEAKQSLWWMAVGPVWTRTQWGGRLSTYFMAGRGIAKASSGQAWVNTQGSDPGTTGVSIVRAGASWAPRATPFDLGVEFMAGGRAAFWDDPPVATDGSGAHILQGRSTTISGALIRLGYTVRR